MSDETSRGETDRYLHGHAESVLRSHRSRTAQNSAAYLLPVLRPGHRLLDIGSGPGTITCDLAEHVAEVIAIEPDEAAIELTRREAAERGASTVICEIADVHRLPYPDDSFDIVHAHQVLQHLPDPVTALREMARVTRPGGYVAARDSDYSGFFWHPRVPALDSWLELYLRLARAAGGEPDAGRWFPTWAAAAGLENAAFTASTWCYTSPDDRRWWGGLWSDRALTSTFTERALEAGVSRAELERISAGWREWAAADTGLFLLPHIELLAQVT